MNMISTDDDKAIYLFCFAYSYLVPEIAGTGMDGKSALIMQKFLDIAAVTSAVSLEDFSGPSAESRMQELSWMGPRACRHEEVIEEVMRRSPVLPARFGTIFFSLERLKRLLKVHYVAILQFLDRVAGKEEWAVKAFLDRGKAQENFLSEALATEAERLASLSPGRRYLQEQRIRDRVVKEMNRWLKVTCKGIWNDVSRYASDVRECKVLFQGLTEIHTDMIFNWAFLVSRDSVGNFHSRIRRANADYQKKGLFFQLSGPWPPYNFCPSLEIEKRG